MGPLSGLCSVFRSQSLPPAEWMASIRALCREVSLGAGLWTTGLNFFFGPKMLGGGVPSTSCMSVHSTLAASSCSRPARLSVPEARGEGGGWLWSGAHLEPFTRDLPGA